MPQAASTARRRALCRTREPTGSAHRSSGRRGTSPCPTFDLLSRWLTACENRCRSAASPAKRCGGVSDRLGGRVSAPPRAEDRGGWEGSGAIVGGAGGAAGRCGTAGNLDPLQARAGDVLSLGHDPVAEGDGAGAALLSRTRSCGRCVGHVQALGVALGRQEHLVVVAVHERVEVGVQPHAARPFTSWSCPKSSNQIRALHAVRGGGASRRGGARRRSCCRRAP